MHVHELCVNVSTPSFSHVYIYLCIVQFEDSAIPSLPLKVYTEHVVDHVIRTLSPMAKHGVVLEHAVSKSVPPIVADERRIIQLLSNIIGNALKFTQKVRFVFVF